MSERQELVNQLNDIARLAGAKATEIYNSDFAIDAKADKSPVTEADRECEALILAALKKVEPDTPVLAEESAADGKIPELGDRFFLVDPLDGTKEFINRTGEFTVNIALIEKGTPVAGVVYAPAINRLFYGAKDLGAFVEDSGPGSARPIAARKPAADGLSVVASRSHRSPETDSYLERYQVSEFTAAGSSLKFCLVAAGEADLYPRLGRTMEWDTGAGQAVLEAAGGSVLVKDTGEPLVYGKKEREFDNPHFIAWGAEVVSAD